MAGKSELADQESGEETLQQTLEDIEYTGRQMGPTLATIVSAIAIAWSLFQLYIATTLPGALDVVGVQKRAIHLAFAFLLCFLMFPLTRRMADRRIPVWDVATAIVATGMALYIAIMYESLSLRPGRLLWVDLAGFTIPLEAIIGGVGILLLLEATRRAIGVPLVIVASVFLIFSVFGQDLTITISVIGVILSVIGIRVGWAGRYLIAAPVLAVGLLVILYAFYGETVQNLLSHKGVSLTRLIGYQWFAQEAIFGLPIDVSVNMVFLFVLFGALLDKAGAGKYFLDLAFAIVGRYRGGPAKAAILASGMTGAISGSSIANVVTTGTFTIPVMRRTGFPAIKAGAIEVAASTNGQIMPPIMGAAAFVMAEFIGITYFEVIVAAIIPAVISYVALFYISHLEALKLDLKGLPRSDIPHLRRTFLAGIHYLIPIVILIYLLIVERWTPGTAVFWSIMALMVLMLIAPGVQALRDDEATILEGVKAGFLQVVAGLIGGARNMVGIGIAVAAAGIIVGAVSATGLSNNLSSVVQEVAGSNILILLGMTALLALVLGMGLPTTANYIVVAGILAPVLVDVGTAAGYVMPLIAVHLYVFYFGLMADSTPPVCLAAFAASAISRADPLATGVQSFLYDIRTAILPLVFIFNTELLLIGVESWIEGLVILFASLVAIFAFSSLTQGWLLTRVKLHEGLMLAVIVVAMFRPDMIMNQFYPPFKEVSVERFASGELNIPEGREVRISVTRESPYGDRFRMFRLTAPEPGTPLQDGYGFTLEAQPDTPERFTVGIVQYGSQAREAGFQPFLDHVTAVEVEQVGAPSKKWIYPFGLLLAGLVILLQWLRVRRGRKAGASSSPAKA